MIYQKKEHIGLGVSCILISTLGFGLYSILGKYAFAGGAGLPTILFVRFTLAALFFWIVTIAVEGFPRLSIRTWLTLWGMGGLGYSLMAGLYLTSVRFIPASLAALLLYAYPIIVTVISVSMKLENKSKLKLLGLMLSSIGLLLVLGIALKGINLMGVFLALGAAFIYAIYIIVGQHVLQKTTALVSTSVISTAAALTYGIIGLPLSAATWNLSCNTWLIIGGIALFSTIIAMWTFFEGMKHIGATSASIISTLEPVMTVILAIVLFHEQFQLIQAVGGLLIVSGSILAVWTPGLYSGQFKKQLL